MQRDVPVLDRDILQSLRTIGGSDALFQRVIKLFLNHAPAAVGTVEYLSAQADLEALADAAHSLKSMCGNIGALAAAQASEELEIAARARADFDAAEMVGRIARELRDVLSAVERLRAA